MTYPPEHLGRWKEGQRIRIQLTKDFVKALHAYTHHVWTVSYDQTHDAYFVYDDEYEDFLDFVAIHWANDNNPQDVDEDSKDYLERIDVQIGLMAPTAVSGMQVVEVGDRIKFRAVTRSDAGAVWRKVNGFWGRWPTVRYLGWHDFLVRPSEILELEKG